MIRINWMQIISAETNTYRGRWSVKIYSGGIEAAVTKIPIEKVPLSCKNMCQGNIL